MRRLAEIACACGALFLTGCGLMELEGNVQAAKDIAATAASVADKAVKIAKNADTNADGKITLQELLIYVGLLLLVGGGWLTKRNSTSNVAKAQVAAKVDNLASEVAWLETKVDKPQ